MYLEHFGLKKNPFQMAPNDEFLYMSEQHTRAMLYMEYASWETGGFVVITGEIGSGKTTLVKSLLRKASDQANIIHMEFTNLTGIDFYYYLLKQVDLEPKSNNKVALIYELKSYLNSSINNNYPNVLIIDEAQNLTNEQLEDIRMLASLEDENGPLLRIILLGQPEFIDMINDSEQFKQRVKLYYHLSGLCYEDVKKYILHRLTIAGCVDSDLFDSKLITKIYQQSHGIPRLINKICDALLMCAYSDNQKKPSSNDLKYILRDLMIGSSKKNTDIQKEVLKDPIHQNFLYDNKLFERFIVAIEDLNKNLSILAKK